MNSKKLFFLTLSLFTALLAHAEEINEAANGNLIAEPALTDYIEGSRAPGIMGQPVEVADLDGNLER